MPIPLSFNRRRLIRPGQPPMGELSQMPEVAPPQPAPIQIPRPEWRPPMAAPEPEPERLPRNWQPPMVTTPHPLEQYADNVQRQTAAAPMQSNASKLGIGLQRPQQIQRPDVPIVGGGGATVADNPYDRANYDYVMEGAKRNPDGSLAGDKIKIKRSGKDIALAALAGLGRGGLVGAATGAIAATIDPKTGRQINFDAFHAPQIQAAMERGQQQDTLQRQAALQGIAMQRGTLGLEQDQAETEMLRQKMRDFPEEMKSIRDERAARAKEREANIKRLLNPVPRPRNVYIDREGLQRDRDTNEIMRDPETGQPIYGKEDATPFSSSGLGIFDTRSGRVTTPVPEKESPEDRYDRAEMKRADTEASRQEVKHSVLKSKAVELARELSARKAELAKIKDTESDEWLKANESVKTAQIQYEGAMGAMEEQAKLAAEASPDSLEYGAGTADDSGRNWVYLKKKDGMRRPSGGGGSRRSIYSNQYPGVSFDY